jgi:hypothetical protein
LDPLQPLGELGERKSLLRAVAGASAVPNLLGCHVEASKIGGDADRTGAARRSSRCGTVGGMIV